MKKSLLFVVFALIASTSFAQLSWNVKAGMNVSNFWGDDPDMKAKVGFKIGGGLEYAFTDIFSIQPSLFVSTKGAKGKGGSKGITINQVYLETPVMGTARFRFQGDMAVVVGAGSYIAYGVGGKTKGRGYDGGTFSDYDMDRFDFGLCSGVTFEFGQFNVGLDGQMGLVEIIDHTDTRNLNLTIGVGYRF